MPRRDKTTGKYIRTPQNLHIVIPLLLFFAWTVPQTWIAEYRLKATKPPEIVTEYTQPVVIHQEIAQTPIEAVVEVDTMDTTEEVWTIATITAYSCGNLKTDAEIRMNCPSLFSGSPKTANGTTPIPYKTMACDRANMGRVFEIEGVGEVKCTDTGGAIKGAGRFDLYVQTVEEARAWGVQKREYRLVEGGE